VAQRRQGHDLERQTVEQVGAEAALLHQARQMLVGGRDDAHVNAHRTRRADPRHLAIFDRAQQPVLGRAGQRGELVQEQGAAVGFLEPALARLRGAGESARFVAEQLRLDQRLGQGRAVEGDERAVPASGKMVQALGDQLLAGTPLADHQHRPVERRRAARALHRIEEGGGLAHELRRPLHCHSLAQLADYWQLLLRERAAELSFSAVLRGLPDLARGLLIMWASPGWGDTQGPREEPHMNEYTRFAGLVGIILTAAAMTFGSSLAAPALQPGPALASAAQMVQHG
jgi:hypothetical protein